MSKENVCAIVEGGRSVVFDLRHRDDHIQSEIATSRTFYEKDVLEEIGRVLVEDGAVCDVGANIGNHTLYFAAILGREVYAFEPLQVAYEQLLRNVRINRCESSVKLFNVALGATSAKGTMEVRPGNLGASRFVLSAAGDTALVTLDESIPGNARVALIKIDVEGLEFEVLNGAARTIMRCKPLLVVEAQDHPAYLRISDYVESLGYLPLAVKGKTRTFFFVHGDKWKRVQQVGQFLIRNDLDFASRRLHGQLDRISHLVSGVPTHPSLAASFSEVTGTMLEELQRVRVGIEDRLADGFASLARAADDPLHRQALRQAIDHLGQSVAAVEAHVSASRREVEEGLNRSHRETEALFQDGVGVLRSALAEAASDRQVLRQTVHGVDAGTAEVQARLTALAQEFQLGLECLRGLARQIDALSSGSQQEARLARDVIEQRLESGLAAVAEAMAATPDRATLTNAVESLNARIGDMSSRMSASSDQVREDIERTFRQCEETLQSQTASVLAGLGSLIRHQDLKAVQDALLRKLEGVTARDTELQRVREEANMLEGELARLQIAVHTERARTQFLSRRLHTLYTHGPRAILEKLTRVANALRLPVKRYESWTEFQRRLEVRVKRDVDDFKKLHARVNVLAQAPACAPASPGRDVCKPNMHVNTATAPALPALSRPVRLQGRPDRVRIGIASIQRRQDALAKVISTLYDQADELLVYLNDYTEVPPFLKREKIRVIHGKGDVGDRGKFYDVEKFQGYVFSCDDDILYPPYYVSHCIDAIERYGRKAAVGWHGSVFKTPFEDYYSPESRRVFSFRAGRPQDVAVHVLGTGCTAFHSSTIKVRYDDFKTANMADVYFALLGQQQKIPFVVIKHDPAEAIPIEIPDDKAIHRESMQSTGSKADTRALQNKLVKGCARWEATLPPVVVNRNVGTIAYVGRIDFERWKKGGILKSSHLIMQSLRALGHRVLPIEISQPVEKLIAAVKDAQIVWIYPGDPQRPDFAPVRQLIDAAANAGKQVYVNLSYNLKPMRTAWIEKHLGEWKRAYGSKVKACLFTHGALADETLASVRTNLTSIPKSITYDRNVRAAFHDTNGIFLGDLQKLLDRELVGGDIEPWIAAVREVLPDVKLYAVRQYGGKIDRDLGLDVLPYTSGREWDQWLAHRRMVCCLTPHATFEMIPVEAAGLGVPVLYRPMPHAHSEALSTAGIQVQSPREFAVACEMLYRDQSIWEMYSNAGRLRAESLHIDHAAAAIHMSLALGSV